MFPAPSRSVPFQTAVAVRCMCFLLCCELSKYITLKLKRTPAELKKPFLRQGKPALRSNLAVWALRNQYDLAVALALYLRFVGARRVREGKLLADHRAERVVFEAGPERGMDAGEFLSRRVEQAHAQNRGVASHGIARVDLD